MDVVLVVDKIPKELAHLLLFENWSNRIIIRAKRPLPKEELSKLEGIIRNLGGRKVSRAGEDLRFEIIEIQRKQIC